MMLEFRNPLPVQTPMGEGYAIYVTSSGPFENDIWAVALDDGRILHFSTNQLRHVGNGTLSLERPLPPHVEPSASSTAPTPPMRPRRR